MAGIGQSRRRPWSAALFVAVVTAFAPVTAQRPAEYQVKAAYLYGFGRFVGPRVSQ